MITGRRTVRCLRLVSALSAARFGGQDGVELHAAVARFLDGLGVRYQRDHSLSPHARVDFWLEGGIALLVSGAPDGAALLRQVRVAAEHDDVREVVAASTTDHALALPDTGHGKVLHRVHLMRL